MPNSKVHLQESICIVVSSLQSDLEFGIVSLLMLLFQLAYRCWLCRLFVQLENMLQCLKFINKL
uniref:Uncharacterized protein n=1 Tax=Anguilla anguilla TaxID=7936 RepID=A0A0E9PFM0_ANGAN